MNTSTISNLDFYTESKSSRLHCCLNEYEAMKKYLSILINNECMYGQ